MHQIDGVWFIFYSSGNSSQECYEGCRPRVLQGCNAASPYYCTYKWRADLVPPAGRQGGSDGRDPFGIDSSFLEVPGKGRYTLVSAMNDKAEQSIQIGKLDTKTWNVTGWHVISEPDQPWERNVSNARTRDLWPGDIAVNEGPHVSAELVVAGRLRGAATSDTTLATLPRRSDMDHVFGVALPDAKLRAGSAALHWR